MCIACSTENPGMMVKLCELLLKWPLFQQKNRAKNENVRPFLVLDFHFWKFAVVLR